MKQLKTTANNHTSSIVKVTENIVKDLMIEYHKEKNVKKKIKIARAIKGAYDTSISAAQVTINAIKISILAKSKDINYKSIQS